MTAPGRSGAEQATIRGLIVLFVAVVVGIGLLSRANGLVGSTESSSDKPKTTTTVSSTTSPTSEPGSTARHSMSCSSSPLASFSAGWLVSGLFGLFASESDDNPVGGWYGLKKGLRGRFGVYLPPLLEALGLAEVEHNPRNNRMRAI